MTNRSFSDPGVIAPEGAVRSYETSKPRALGNPWGWCATSLEDSAEYDGSASARAYGLGVLGQVALREEYPGVVRIPRVEVDRASQDRARPYPA